MTLDRRQLLIFGSGMVVAGGLAAWLLGGDRLAAIGGVTGARAAASDLSTLLEPPALGDRVLGRTDAPVTIIEYASASCPHCATFHKDVFPELKKDYIDTGKVRFIFREFPHDDLALAAFMLARCAPKDKYFPMVDVLFEQQKVWPARRRATSLFKIAQLAGFTQESFDACLKNEDIAKGIMAMRDKAANDLRRRGDPDLLHQWRGASRASIRSISSAR